MNEHAHTTPDRPADLTDGEWPAGLPAVEFRLVRPTARLAEITAFYRDLLGLPELHSSSADGWSVTMIGLPGDRYHLEFVSHEDGIDGRAPTAENLLVFYFPGAAEMEAVAGRLRAAGVPETGLDNPWWDAHGAVAFLDPDEWRIVLMPRAVVLARASST